MDAEVVLGNALLVLMTGFIALGKFAEHRFYCRIRDHHPETWERLGRPGLGFNVISKADWDSREKMSEFLATGAMNELDDPELIRRHEFYGHFAFLGAWTWLLVVGLGILFWLI